MSSPLVTSLASMIRCSCAAAHIEHLDNAVKQGSLAAKNMLGRRLRSDTVSYFFCDIGDLSFNVLGAPEAADHQIARGALGAGSFALFLSQR